MKRFFALLFAACLTTLPSFGQDFPLFSYRYGDPTGHDSNGRVELVEYSVRAPLPVVNVSKKTTLKGSAGFHHISLHQQHRFWRESPYDTFRLDAAVSHSFSDEWTLQMGASERFDRNLFGEGQTSPRFSRVGLIATRSFRSGNELSFGAAYRTGVPTKILPLVGIDTDFASKMRIEALLPSRVVIWRKFPRRSNRIGVHARYTTTPYFAADKSNQKVLHKIARIGLSEESRLSGNLYVRVDISWTIKNELEFDNDQTSLDLNVNRAPMIDISLRYKLPTR